MTYKTAFLAVIFGILTLLGGDTHAGTRPAQVWFQQCQGETSINAEWHVATEGIMDSFGQVIFPPKIYNFNITCYGHTGQASTGNYTNFPSIPYEAGNVAVVKINMVIVNSKTKERHYDSISTDAKSGTWYPSNLDATGGFGQIGFGIADVNP